MPLRRRPPTPLAGLAALLAAGAAIAAPTAAATAHSTATAHAASGTATAHAASGTATAHAASRTPTHAAATHATTTHATHATRAAATHATTTQASNRTAATRAAIAIVRHTPRPARARRVATEPAGDGQLLASPPGTPATGALVDRHAIYVADESLRTVERFYARHRPSRASLVATGAGGGAGVPRNRNLTWGWPTGRAIVSRQTLLDLVALGHRRTGIRIDAQVVWRVPRPAGERVPGGVRAISITRTQPGHPPDLSRTVSGPSRVHAIAAMIDRLPIVQPGAIACPVLLAGTPVVTFAFRASRSGPALATASEPADVTDPTNACDALSFQTGAHVWPSLLGGARFLHRVDRTLHAHFAMPPGVTVGIPDGR